MKVNKISIENIELKTLVDGFGDIMRHCIVAGYTRALLDNGHDPEKINDTEMVGILNECIRKVGEVVHDDDEEHAEFLSSSRDVFGLLGAMTEALTEAAHLDEDGNPKFDGRVH